MKSLFLVLFFMTISSLGFASREVQNGGGGWVSNDQYMTFYSAKIPVRRQSISYEKIPGLSFLLNKVNGLVISPSDKARLTKLFLTIGKRKYYSVDEGKFDKEFRQELIEKYSKLMGIPADNVTLFAVTDRSSWETFLLPEFYKLKEVEQAAILFHESLWLLREELTYSEVVWTETVAQAYFQEPQSAERFYDFHLQLSTLLGDIRSVLYGALVRDTQVGAFQGRENIRVSDLFPDLIKLCGTTTCNQVDISHVIELGMKYPQSVFLKLLIQLLDEGRQVSWQNQCSSNAISECAFLPNEVFIGVVPSEQVKWSADESQLVVFNSRGVKIGTILIGASTL